MAGHHPQLDHDLAVRDMREEIERLRKAVSTAIDQLNQGSTDSARETLEIAASKSK